MNIDRSHWFVTMEFSDIDKSHWFVTMEFSDNHMGLERLGIVKGKDVEEHLGFYEEYEDLEDVVERYGTREVIELLEESGYR